MKKTIPISKSTIGIKCGDCLFFKGNKKFEKPCSELGVKHFTNAPACYSPNVYKLAEKNPDVILQLGLLLKDFTASDTRILMSVLKQQTAFEKNYNLQFGQPVYFRIGDDYLSNYYKGYVIGVATTGEGMVFLTSDLEKKQRIKPAVVSLFRDSLQSVSQFRKIKEALQKSDRLIDPKGELTKRAATAVSKVDYEPPTIDKAPKERLENKRKKVPKSRLIRAADGSFEFIAS